MQMSQTARAEQFCSKGQRNASPSKLYNTDLMFGGTFLFTSFSVEKKSSSFMAVTLSSPLLMTHRKMLMVQWFDFTHEFGVLVPITPSWHECKPNFLPPLWHGCDKSCTVCCQSHCFTQPPLFIPHMNFQPTMSKSTLPTSIFHAASIPAAFTLTIILFSFLWFYINYCTLSISHFTSATGFLERHFSGNF